ncbi:MAG: HNH endonuclease [Oscillospiraceae bacterium]|nr:HNH endonuclease [Oscillospiraceae bacterium]
MPRLPKKPCSYPGCPRLTDDVYCEEHMKQVVRQYEQHGRDKNHSKRYGRGWQAIRRAYVQAHPLCERCLKQGRYVKVEEVHHIKPLADGGTNDESNLMSLCRKCHAEIHAELGTRSHNETVYSYDGSHHS